jgi:hypothetical protein
MANRLDQIQSFMDAGTVTQSNFNLNISNEEQLADMNDWLARLSDSIATGQMPQQESIMDTATSFAYNQMSNFTPPPQQQGFTQYPIVPSQQQPMYPTSCEENELYVRSQPMPQPVVPSQNPYQQPYMNYQVGGVTTGQRQHYTTVPNVSNHYFQPELRTTTNFTKANNPENGEIEKEETVSFKPTKTVTHDEKKNMATLVNTFSSALDTTKKSSPVKKETIVTEEPTRKKSDDLIRELITSDLSKLSLNDDADEEVKEKKSSADNASLAASTTLYPTASAAINNNHLLLLKKMTEWVNENYRKSHSSSTSSSSTLTQQNIVCQ